MKFASFTKSSLFTLCCATMVFLALVSPVLASPHRLPGPNQHKRFVKHNLGKVAHVPKNTKAFKRYVIPSKKHGHINSPAKAFKSRAHSTFQHSEKQVKLSRTADQPSSLNKRKDTHPLLYWTQHYNRALGRHSKALPSDDLKKRSMVEQHAQESTDRLHKRWRSIYGDDKPMKVQQKRHILVSPRKPSLVVPLIGVI